MARQTRTLIIGSGVAGSLVARELLRKGHGPVLMLEAGPPVVMRDRRRWLDFVMARRLPYQDHHDRPDDFSSDGVSPWHLVGGRLFGRGGSTVHWGGWTPRAQPEDFTARTNTGEGMDWPYDYDALEPHYCRAETYLQVAGDSDTGPRRSQPYPLPPPALPLQAGPVIEALSRLGYSFQILPIARNTRSIGGRPACRTIGTCDYCPIGARFTGDQPLEDLEGDRGFTLLVNAAARRILMSGKALAAGVEYVDTTTGKSETVEAEQVFVCAGALETPKLLMASASADWKQGIGNDADLLGRFVVASPFLVARGRSPANPEKIQAELNFPTLCSRQWDTPEEQLAGNKLFLSLNPDTPFVDMAQLMDENRTPGEIAAAATGPREFEIWGSIQEKGLFENRVTLGDGTTRFGLPRTRIDIPARGYTDEVLNAYLDRMKGIVAEMDLELVFAGTFPQRGDHAMGTARMAASDTEGVVGPDLRVHGVDNLYVASNAVFPQSMAANPTLTLMAAIFKALDSIPACTR
jgi:choline dehydrogenase-like flavoprotein